MLELSTKFKKGELNDLKKAINRLANNPVKLLFPKITGGLSLVVYSDGAFQNLPDQIGSRRGHFIMLAGSRGRVAPLALAWTNTPKLWVGVK